MTSLEEEDKWVIEMKTQLISSSRVKRLCKTKRSRKRIRWLGILTLLIIMVTFFNAGNWLTVSQNPQRSDIIIVLSGSEGRVEKALGLMEEDYSDFLVLTNAYGFSEQDYKHIESTVPAEDVIKDFESHSTLDSAYYSRKLMEELRVQSAIIVSSDYHLRRAKLNYERAFKNSDIELKFVASDSNYQSDFWWTDNFSIRITGSEYIKLVGNLVGIHGPFAKKKLYEFDDYIFS